MISSLLSFLVEIILLAIVFKLVLWVLGLIGLVLPAGIITLLLAAFAIILVIRLVGILKGTTKPYISLW